jgi:hypothetical protein
MIATTPLDAIWDKIDEVATAGVSKNAGMVVGAPTFCIMI